MNRFLNLFRARRESRDLAVEIEEHLEERAQELMASGLDRKSAELAARRAFDNVTRVREVSREMWTWASLERLIR
jgi:hypothetical protein